MSSKGQSGMGQDQDDTIFVPYTTVMKKLRGVTFISQRVIDQEMLALDLEARNMVRPPCQ